MTPVPTAPLAARIANVDGGRPRPEGQRGPRPHMGAHPFSGHSGDGHIAGWLTTLWRVTNMTV